jgi:hypothetical protein
MATDTEIKLEGMAVLMERLGIVEAERFIALLQREKFDYTKWREPLWEDKNVRELSADAMKKRKGEKKSQP